MRGDLFHLRGRVFDGWIYGLASCAVCPCVEQVRIFIFCMISR